MLVIPIGRENAVLRRHAWVTWTIIALNIAAFFFFCTGTRDDQRIELIRSWRATITYLDERPYLEIPWQARGLMPEELPERRATAHGTVGAWKAMREQQTAAAMAADLRELHDSIPDVRLAYVPAKGGLETILSSMFLHAGIVHLLGNMIFLFATAPFVEDAFGRPLFALLYVTGGIAATLAFASRDPSSVIPLVGASGAIAAVMGAYLVRFATSRLSFLFLPVPIVPFWSFRFSLPALVVLPLWFLEQLVSIPAEGSTGVAVTAHVAGFAYGVVFAFAVKLTRVEERLIAPAIEKQISWSADPRLERAFAAYGAGNLPLAAAETASLLAEQPGNEDALRLALDVALAREEPADIDRCGAQLLSRLAPRDVAAARELVEELGEGPYPEFFGRAASFAERTGSAREAMGFYSRIAELNGSAAVPALVKLAVLRRSAGDAPGSRAALEQAQQHPGCSAEWRRRIDSTRAMLEQG